MSSVVLSVNTDNSINTPIFQQISKFQKRKKKKKLKICYELSSCLTQIHSEHRKELQTSGFTKQPTRIWHCWLA